MVFDHLEYASDYFNLGHGIRAALAHLQQADVAALEPGRHSVAGDRAFALVSDYETKSPEEAGGCPGLTAQAASTVRRVVVKVRIG